MTRKPSLARGLWTGLAAGIAGSLAMAAFQELVVRLSTAEEHADHGRHAPPSTEESTTETTARRVSRYFGSSLTMAQKQHAGRALHYGFGALMGLGYGAVAEYLPLVGVGAGVPFGTVLFFATDTAALPLLRLASQPAETPLPDHLLHWASHLAYTGTMELTRRTLVRLS